MAGRDRPRWIVIAVLCLPVAIAAVAALVSGWTPVADWALIELRVRDVGSADTPLLGPYSRFGWNHPGPAMFWLLAVPYRLMGSVSAALLFGVGIVNLASVAGIGWVAHRRGGMPLLAWTSLLCSLFLFGLGPFLLVDPWNPSVVVLPFALLTLLCWSLAEGDHRLVPLTALVASWVAQAHVGFAPLVGVFLVWGLGWLVARHRSPVVWRWLLAGMAVTVVVWLPPLVEQAVERPGNMVEIVRHFAGLGAPESLSDPPWAEPLGGRAAAGVFGRHLAPVGVWLGGDAPMDPSTGALLGAPWWHAAPLLLIFVGAGAFAWRRRATDAVLLAAQVALGLVVGFVATTRLSGSAYSYLFGWLAVLALCCWLSAGWSIYRGLQVPVRGRVDRLGVRVLLGASAVVLVAASVRSFGVEPAMAIESAAVRTLANDVTAAVDGRTALLSAYGQCFDEVAFGIALEVERSGGSIVVTGWHLTNVGESRRWTGENADIELSVRCSNSAEQVYTDLAVEDGLEVVAQLDPTPPELARREAEIKEDLIAEIDRLGRPDLLEQIDNWVILTTGIEAGVDPALLADYRELVDHHRRRITVLIDNDFGGE